MIDLRRGDWHQVLADVECDALISDPPYSERNHRGHDSAVRDRGDFDGAARRSLNYGFWDANDISDFVKWWAPRTRGWMAVMTSHDLMPAWEGELRAAGRYVFAPLPCVIRAMTVRLAADGPSSWSVWLVVSRPRNREFSSWGVLPGAYVVNRDSNAAGHIGGKPRALMLQIVRDYSREGDLVCDPCAGYGTTLRAAEMLGRRAIGAEIDPETWAKAMGQAPMTEDDGQLALWGAE